MSAVRYSVSASELRPLYCSVLQSCPAVCDLMDCSPPDSSVQRNSQARAQEWVAISFSRGSSQPRDWTQFSYIGRQILYHWATIEVPQLLWAKVAGLPLFILWKLRWKPQPAPCPSSARRPSGQLPSPPHPIMPHRASSGQHFSIGTTEQAIFICSVWIKYKEHCAPPLK